MKPKTRLVLEQCIEAGVKRGYRRAHKHISSPDEDVVFHAIEECIMGEIYEWFDFEDAPE